MEASGDTSYYVRLAVSNVAFHLVKVNLAHGLLCVRPVHVDVHNVLSDHLRPALDGIVGI